MSDCFQLAAHHWLTGWCKCLELQSSLFWPWECDSSSVFLHPVSRSHDEIQVLSSSRSHYVTRSLHVNAVLTLFWSTTSEMTTSFPYSSP